MSKGTFWVIGGERVRKKAPFVISKVEREMHEYKKEEKERNELVLDERYEERIIDYGMFRCSASSLRDYLFAPLRPAISSAVLPLLFDDDQPKGKIFLDLFVPFDYNDKFLTQNYPS